MKKRLTRIVCLLLCVGMAICTAACKKNESFEDKISASLKAYLTSENFAQAVSETYSAQDRVPQLYLKYVSGNYYSSENADIMKTTMSYIEELMSGDEISNGKFDDSTAKSTGFGSVTDYLYTWSIVYNQYKLYCGYTAESDEYNKYLTAIKEYVIATDAMVESDYIAVPWGYGAENVLPLIAANLGFDGATPNCDAIMLSYYEKTSGEFTKDCGYFNWNGFSGRPLAASLYTNNANYDAEYEKTMQGYFPINDDSAYLIEDLVTLDRLPANFNHRLSSDYGELSLDPEYALLTAVAHGINMFEYKVSDKTYDVFALWQNGLTLKDGNYVIDNFKDMAVAIAYIALQKGVTAPTPVGLYADGIAVITL